MFSRLRQRICKTPIYATSEIHLSKSKEMAEVEARASLVSGKVRRLALDSIGFGGGAIVLTIGAIALFIIASSPGDKISGGSLLDDFIAVRSGAGSEIIIGIPSAIVLPAVLAVILAPSDFRGMAGEPERWEHESSIEFLRVLLFSALLFTALLAAFAAIPASASMLGESLVGFFLLALSAGLSALLRPQGVIRDYRRAESKARLNGYRDRLEDHAETCRKAGVPDWMLSSSEWSGFGVRLYVWLQGFVPIFLFALGLLYFFAAGGGRQPWGVVASLASIAVIMGAFAGLPWLLSSEAGGVWRTGIAGRSRWVEVVHLALLGAALLIGVALLVLGAWIDSDDGVYRTLMSGFGVFCFFGYVHPRLLLGSRLTAAMDYRHLMERAGAAKKQAEFFGGDDD